MVEERDRIPYPVDEGLIGQAQLIGDGKHVHDINRAIANYRYAARRWQEKWEAWLWYDAVQRERELRGIVVEAKLGKDFQAPWAKR